MIEAGEFSGTRITARCAMEQNRDVFAVPGNVTNKHAWGPNTLIKQGAKLTATWEDVWEDLPSTDTAPSWRMSFTHFRTARPVLGMNRMLVDVGISV